MVPRRRAGGSGAWGTAALFVASAAGVVCAIALASHRGALLESAREELSARLEGELSAAREASALLEGAGAAEAEARRRLAEATRKADEAEEEARRRREEEESARREAERLRAQIREEDVAIASADPYTRHPELRVGLTETQRSQRYLNGGNAGNRFVTEILSWEPRVVLYKGFVTAEEIAHIERLAEGHLTRSKVVTDNASDTIQSGRTSDGVFFSGSLRTGVINALEERVANATRLPAHFGEDFYYLRYKKGQAYLPHTDYCYRPPEPGMPPGSGLKTSCRDKFLRCYDPDEGAQNYADRIATAIVQLRSPEEGGESAFPSFHRRGLPHNQHFTSAGGRDDSWMGDPEDPANAASGRGGQRRLLASDGDREDAAFEEAKRKEQAAKERLKRDRYLPHNLTFEGEGAIPWPGYIFAEWGSFADPEDDRRWRARTEVKGYDEGWCTSPNMVNVLRVKPDPGDMVLFYNYNIDGSNDGAALHGGCPVLKGEKHIMTKWIRSAPMHSRKRPQHAAPWEGEHRAA